uniref:Uncharacterized protein n=1 Tax=Anguilla anguilla TaxID=7936 RepID=A0A0E9QSH9_ANGAN
MQRPLKGQPELLYERMAEIVPCNYWLSSIELISASTTWWPSPVQLIRAWYVQSSSFSWCCFFIQP